MIRENFKKEVCEKCRSFEPCYDREDFFEQCLKYVKYLEREIAELLSQAEIDQSNINQLRNVIQDNHDEIKRLQKIIERRK